MINVPEGRMVDSAFTNTLERGLPMCTFIFDNRFFEALREIDLEHTKGIKADSCPHCGGVLDVSNYPRKPRGLRKGEDFECRRFSFCCRKCRKRLTPQSVRFLGRKVYVGSVVILAMSEAWLRTMCDQICRQTLRRWKRYWADVLGRSSRFWKKAKARLSPGFEANGSPISIVEYFLKNHQNKETAFTKCLEFFSPLSVLKFSG